MTAQKKNLLILSAIALVVALVIGGYLWQEHSKNEAARRALTNAVIACGGDVAHHLREADSLAASHPSLSYPQALELYRAALSFNCK